MIVLVLTDCPPSLRGELTRWLLEINSGVFVGRVSARVREKIWQRVQEEAKYGRATMVFSSGKGEQRLDFCTHHADWEPVDFDGLKLMLRPSTSRLASRKKNQTNQLTSGFSKAARFQRAKKFSRSHRHKGPDRYVLERYVVIDVETTGLNPDRDEIMEIGAVKVRDSVVESTFHSVLKIVGKIPNQISALTGLTDRLLQDEGQSIEKVLPEFLEYVSDLPVVTHNGEFDYAFIRYACSKQGLPLFSNPCIDTLKLSRRYIDLVANYQLETLTEYLGIPAKRFHRSLDDCFATMQLYQKLIEIIQSGS